MLMAQEPKGKKYSGHMSFAISMHYAMVALYAKCPELLKVMQVGVCDLLS